MRLNDKTRLPDMDLANPQDGFLHAMNLLVTNLHADVNRLIGFSGGLG